MSDNPMEHFHKLFGPSPAQIEYMQKVRKEGEAMEAEILMGLWKDVGDFSETYWQAMTAMSAFVKLVETYKKGFNSSELSPIERRVLTAFVDIIQRDISFSNKNTPPE